MLGGVFLPRWKPIRAVTQYESACQNNQYLKYPDFESVLCVLFRTTKIDLFIVCE